MGKNKVAPLAILLRELQDSQAALSWGFREEEEGKQNWGKNSSVFKKEKQSQQKKAVGGFSINASSTRGFDGKITLSVLITCSSNPNSEFFNHCHCHINCHVTQKCRNYLNMDGASQS
ncbi:uncharacterized protein LOC128197783 [Vigna angularis]|uniref:uncharacterized protein LOC128197783 n=1 Tax=Phaseolus angularis TaxID=3914 RepID=UPI0022B57B59|nr:uncharacterized protein LOC128197783 [Vigna angularis]